jgi:hypothetical protein
MPDTPATPVVNPPDNGPFAPESFADWTQDEFGDGALGPRVNWVNRDYEEGIFVGPAIEIWAGRKATPFNSSWRRDYTRRFRVIVNRPDVSPVQVCYAPGLPLPFSPYYPDPAFDVTGNGYGDLLALATQMTAEIEVQDDFQSWIVTVFYTTEMTAEGSHLDQNGDAIFDVLPDRTFGAPNNPWEERPTIKWQNETIQVAPYRDLDGKWFLNSAMQPYTPAPSFDVACPVLVISRNERWFNRAYAEKYAYSLNQDVFEGADPFLAQCLPITAEQQYRGGQRFFRVEIRIRFAPSTAQLPLEDPSDPDQRVYTWQPRILDAGLYRLNNTYTLLGFTFPIPNPNMPVPIFRHGMPITQPDLLDGHGQPVLPLTLEEAVADGDDTLEGKRLPVYNNYRIRKAVEFGTLLTTGLTPP